MNDKVEILLATYNGEKYVQELIESILNQSYTNWIIRAGDDSSTDSTYDILLKYKEKYPEKFIIEKNIPGCGSAKYNFLNLISKSTCRYVMCCDQDDVWLPHKIEWTLKQMKHDENGKIPVLIHTDIKVVDSSLNVINPSFFEYSKFKKEFKFKDLLIQNYVTGCTMMMNRQLVELVKREKDYEKILMHDWYIALLAAAYGKVGFVDKPTMLYRQHAINSVGAKQYGIALFIEKCRKHSLKKSLEDTVNQISQLLSTYGDDFPRRYLRLIENYSTLYKKKKLQRVAFFIKNKVYKNGLARIICQLLIC